MMSVVGKSTCSGFKTGLYISYHGGNAVRYIKQRDYFMKDAQRQSKKIYMTLPTSMESSTATNSSFPEKLLLVIRGLCCAGWNGCSGDLHRCGQYPMNLLRLPFWLL